MTCRPVAAHAHLKTLGTVHTVILLFLACIHPESFVFVIAAMLLNGNCRNDNILVPLSLQGCFAGVQALRFIDMSFRVPALGAFSSHRK